MFRCTAGGRGCYARPKALVVRERRQLPCGRRGLARALGVPVPASAEAKRPANTTTAAASVAFRRRLRGAGTPVMFAGVEMGGLA